MTWRPKAALGTLRARAKKLAELRSFFAARDSLEIDVPTIALAPASDPWIDSFSVFDIEKRHIGYLLSSPEPYLKRCLAELKRPIHAVTHAYRASEEGNLHASEFTMLEWYRPVQERRMEAMACELNELVTTLTDFSEPIVIEYCCLFDQMFGFNPHQVSKSELVEFVTDSLGFKAAKELALDDLLNLLFVNHIQPHLDCHIVIEFPAIQASLSRIDNNKSGYRVAKRVELYISGVEIANGYDELVDVNEQKSRFHQDRLRRLELDRPEVPEDIEMLSALTVGLPNSYGVALGIDRLMMVVLGERSLEPCMTFMDI